MRTFAVRIFAIFAVLVLGLNALETRHGLTNTQIKRIQNLKAGNTWGSLILSLAEMHTLAEGPIDDLVEAIEEIVNDLEAKLQRAEEEYDQRTQAHNAEVRTLTDLINEAERNIADTQALIENVLVPQRNQLTEEIANLYRLIDETNAYITQTTTDRESAHSAFLERVEDHNEGIAAIQEALGVLEQLNEETSLIQVKKLHKSVEKIVKHVEGKHSVESAFVKSLLALTSSEFANSDQVEQVRNLLIKVLGNLETSLTDEQAAEEKAQEEFVEDIKRQQGNIASYTNDISEKTEDLAHTEEQISNANEYIEERTADLAGYNKDLDEENASYEAATEAYNDLVAQLNNESSAASEALQVVKTATIEDYIGDRIDQKSEHVIGTNHGSGVQVAGGRFEFN